MGGALQMRVGRGQAYPMEQLGGLRKAISDVGLWLSPERLSHVAMAPALTNPSRGMWKSWGSRRGEVE